MGTCFACVPACERREKAPAANKLPLVEGTPESGNVTMGTIVSLNTPNE